MSDVDSLGSVSAWTALSPSEREALLARLCERMPAGFRPGRVAVSRAGLGELIHEPSGVSFIVIPGGWLRMGLSPDDVLHALGARSKPASPRVWTRSWADELLHATPAHVVSMRAFLVAREPGEAALNAIAGARLPSEAELEWIAREGQATRWLGIPPGVVMTQKSCYDLLMKLENGFGVEGLHHEWNACADSWHVGYAGAPTDGSAWGDACTVKRIGHASWQDDDEELIALHAAYRAKGAAKLGMRRAVLDIPGAPRPEPPALPEADHADTLAALRGADGGARDVALSVLRGFEEHPVGGCAQLLADLERALPELGEHAGAVVAFLERKRRPPPEPKPEVQAKPEVVDERAARELAAGILGARPAHPDEVALRALGVVADRALDRLFPAGELPLLVEELTPPQRVFLDAVAALDIPAHWASHRLFSRPWDRARWLSGKPGPLDAIVSTSAGPRPIWWALLVVTEESCAENRDEEAHARAAEEILAGLGPIERLLLQTEANRYDLHEMRETKDGERYLSPVPGTEADLRGCIQAARKVSRVATRKAVRALADRALAEGARFFTRRLLVALAATVRPGTELPERFDALIGHEELGSKLPPKVVAALGPARMAAVLLRVLEPRVAAAKRARSCDIGASILVRNLAPYLAVTRSPEAARRLLQLGLASGFPDEARSLVSQHGGRSSAMKALLARSEKIPYSGKWSEVKKAILALEG